MQVVDTEKFEDAFAQIVLEEKVILGGRSLKLLSDAASDTGKARG